MPKGLPVVPRLLADLGIETLIVVDDEWEAAARPALEEVIGWMQATLFGDNAPEKARIGAALADLGLDTESWPELLRSRWDAGDDSARAELAARLVASETDTSGRLPAIAAWFADDGPKLLQVTPERWNAEGEGLLDQAKGSVICLFDERLGEGRTGTTLLQAAMAKNREKDRFFFGLLTGTVEVSSEVTRTATLQRDVTNERVIVIAKNRAYEPPEFAARLHLLVQLTYHDGLRSIAKTAMKEAMEDTGKRLDALTVADFDRIVIETARREGTWEADELLRLIGIWERSERRARMLARRGEIEQLLTRIRVARPPSAKREPASPRVRGLRRLDLYATEDINATYLPIELGDVFSVGEKEYVLLVQPCDTMVRTKGTRGRQPDVAPLAAIIWTDTAAPDGPADAFFQLEYYEATEGKKAYLDFRKVTLAPLAVLDLVSFHLDGEATIDPDAPSPTAAFPSMQKRYEALAKAFKVVHADVAAAEALVAAEQRAEAEKLVATEKPARGAKPAVGAPTETEGSRLRRLAWAPYTGDETLTLAPSRSDTELRFGLRRVGRILAPHAAAALTRFHQWRSRPAFEADFAREYPEPPSGAGPSPSPDISTPEASGD